LNFPEGTLFNRVNTDRFKYKEITDIILRSFYEVYNELGDGFLESVYESALHIVLTGYGLCVERQKDISVFFRANIIGNFRADLIVEGKVVLEIKAVRTLDPAHEAQLINYLKARPPRLSAKPMAGRQQTLKLAYY